MACSSSQAALTVLGLRRAQRRPRRTASSYQTTIKAHPDELRMRLASARLSLTDVVSCLRPPADLVGP